MSLKEQIEILKKEALRRPAAIATTVLLVSLFMLALGLLWNEKYESVATIYVERDKIIEPLLEGATVVEGERRVNPEAPPRHIELAKHIVFSRDVMEEVLEQGGWLEADPPLTLLEREALIENLRKAIKVEPAGQNVLEIRYRNESPERAFKVVMTASSELLTRARDMRQSERRDAFRFISAEVEEYAQQLRESERKLQAFLAEHEEVQLGATDPDTTISDLRRDIQTARLDLEAARIRERSLVDQLEGRATAGASITREDEILEQIATLESELASLRLRYHDTYPDIVAIRYQIEELREQLEAERNGAATGGGERILANPMRAELRRELQLVRTEIASLENRIAQSEQWLRDEYARGVNVAGVQAQAEQLARDYEVTKEIYQDLLKRRESARIAMQVEDDGEGTTMSMQEAPTMPLTPSGLRFLHFALLGPLLGIGVAFGNLFMRVRFDDRIRAGSTISRELAIPVLATVPVLADDSVRTGQRRVWVTAIAAVLLLLACYVFVVSLRITDLL